MKLQGYRCDRCSASFDEEGRGSCWKQEGLGKRCGDDKEWDLCEACDGAARKEFARFMSAAQHKPSVEVEMPFPQIYVPFPRAE